MAAEEWRILIQDESGGGSGGGAGESSTGEGSKTEQRDLDQKTRTFFEQATEQFKNLKPFIVTGGLLYIMYQNSQITSTVMKTIGQILGAIMDVILLPFMPLFTKMVEIIVPLIPEIQKLADAFFTPIVDFVASKLEIIKNWIQNIDWSAVEEWVGNAGETVAGWISKAYNWLTEKLYPWWTDKAWPWLQNEAWPKIIAIKDWVMTQAPKYLDAIVNWWEKTGYPKFKEISDWVGRAYDWLAKYIPYYAGEAINWWNKIAYPKLVEIAGWVKDAYNWWITTGKDKFDDVVEAVGHVASAINTVSGAVSAVSNANDWLGTPEWYKPWTWGAQVAEWMGIPTGLTPRENRQIGGYISTTGMYQLHEGEEVIPAALVRALDNRSMNTSPASTSIEMHNTFNIELIPSGSVDELARDVEKKITDKLSTILRRQ